MREFLIRLRLPLLFAMLVLLTLISMLADRRVLAGFGRERSFGGALLELAPPVQKALLFPSTSCANGWSRYWLCWDSGARTTSICARAWPSSRSRTSSTPRRSFASATSRRSRDARGVDVPLHSAQVVGHDVSPWFRSS